jgi:hypothetical protein
MDACPQLLAPQVSSMIEASSTKKKRQKQPKALAEALKSAFCADCLTYLCAEHCESDRELGPQRQTCYMDRTEFYTTAGLAALQKRNQLFDRAMKWS